MFNLFKNQYIDWNDYKSHIDFMDVFLWQQSVRRANLKRITP